MKNIHMVPFVWMLFSVSVVAADMRSTFTLPSGVEVVVIEAPFTKNQFKIEGCSDKDTKCRINGHLPFGVAFGLPKTYVKSITVSFQGRIHALDVSGMYDAWGGRPLEYPGIVRYFGGKCFDTKTCQFRGLFSDGAGSFVAEWRIIDGRSSRTVLTDSDDIVDLFMKHIDPPEID